MLIWKRVIPKNFRSLVAIGTLSAMVALAPAMRYSTTLGQDPRPGNQTGIGVISLAIYQNGMPVGIDGQLT